MNCDTIYRNVTTSKLRSFCLNKQLNMGLKELNFSFIHNYRNLQVVHLPVCMMVILHGIIPMAPQPATGNMRPANKPAIQYNGWCVRGCFVESTGCSATGCRTNCVNKTRRMLHTGRYSIVQNQFHCIR